MSELSEHNHPDPEYCNPRCPLFNWYEHEQKMNPGKPDELSERRALRVGHVDGTAQLGCPKCQNVWWFSPGIVLNAETMNMESFGYPLQCIECGYELHAGDV